jgi:hypothetical protein
MALINCGECSKEISDKAVACPHCGAPREVTTPAATSKKAAVKKNSSNSFLNVILIILGIVLFMSILGGSNSKKSEPREKVFNSSWDGSVYQAEMYLKDRLKDPSSYESINWGKVNKNPEGNYVTWVKYRAKNSFGGYNIGTQVFELSPRGDVLSMHELGE